MSKKTFKVLVPVDLSKNSLSALELATQLAKQKDGELCFMYVAPPLLPEEAMFGNDYLPKDTEEFRREFEQLRPSDSSVSFNHLFQQGNAGHMIAKASKDADLCVMSTHGRTGVIRLIMGSVAQYVLRNASCPVVLVKGFEEFASVDKRQSRSADQSSNPTNLASAVRDKR